MTKHCVDCKYVVIDKSGLKRCRLDPIPQESNQELIAWLVSGDGDGPGAHTEFFLASTARAGKTYGDCGFDAKLFEPKELD